MLASRSLRALGAWLVLTLGCSTPVVTEDGGSAGDAAAAVDAAAGDGGADAGIEPRDGGVDAGSPPSSQACDAICAEHEVCDPAEGSCVCEPGYRRLAGCVANGPRTAPLARDAAAACELWRLAQIHEVPAGEPGWEYSSVGGRCDPGVQTEANVRDTVRRINGHRALMGAQPLEPDPDASTWDDAQARALTVAVAQETRDDYDFGVDCHNAEPYSPVIGAWEHVYAGEEVVVGAEAITVHLRETDWDGERSQVNGTVFFDPATRDLIFGFVAGGLCGGARTNVSEMPDWFAHPAPGAYPIELFGERWAFFAHQTSFDSNEPVVQVVRMSDGEVLRVREVTWLAAWGYDGVSFVPDGWSAEPGESYEVSVGNLDPASRIALERVHRYVITPVDCGGGR